jgi:Flp pilus assembly protein TadD
LPAFDRAIETNPKDGRAHCFKGAILFDLGKRSEALRCFDRALALDPTDEMALKYRTEV